MDARERRTAILQLLRGRTQPVTGTELARRMGVSRQVIVQDIALLRTGGANIFATPEGYLMPTTAPAAVARRVVAARHTDNARMRRELELIVENGGIEHPVYGEISAPLMLRTRAGVEVFMAHFEKGGTTPISMLTGGVHLHTLEAPGQEELEAVVQALRAEGLLIE